jgi:glutamine synthetase adenylyltransferase
MVDEGRRRSMREYQQRRTAARRDQGLVTRTAWIRSEDAEAFALAIAPFADHAKLIEAVIGSLTVSPIEIVEIIKKHGLPYDPGDVVFMTRIYEELALRPDDYDQIIERARTIIARYGFRIAVEDLM